MKSCRSISQVLKHTCHEHAVVSCVDVHLCVFLGTSRRILIERHLLAMAVDSSDGPPPGHRVFQLPPPGYHVEWQVHLQDPEQTTETWATYAPHYQLIMEELFTGGAAGLDYQPGRTQTYRIHFDRLVQVRTSCPEGWGSERRIRRVFVPDDPPRETAASGSMSDD